jgi:hypothetical protein
MQLKNIKNKFANEFVKERENRKNKILCYVKESCKYVTGLDLWIIMVIILLQMLLQPLIPLLNISRKE